MITSPNIAWCLCLRLIVSGLFKRWCFINEEEEAHDLVEWLGLMHCNAPASAAVKDSVDDFASLLRSPQVHRTFKLLTD